jgi:hypothetical protein
LTAIKPLTDDRWFKSHWLTFAWLVPFLAMLGLHRLLKRSDALLAAPAPGERDAQLYTFTRVLVFNAGIGAHLWHTFATAPRKPGWVAFKLIFLAMGWTGLLLVLG